MKKLIMLVLTSIIAVSIIAVAPAQADAAPYLSMAKAKKKMNSVTTDMALDDPETTDWGIEDCSRISRSKVECWQWFNYADDGLGEMYCTGRIRARKTNYGFISVSFPGDPICNYYDE